MDYHIGDSVVIHGHEKNNSRCYADYERIIMSIAGSEQMDKFSDLDMLIAWIRSRPFIADLGGHNDCRCNPGQRFNIWPNGGLNCWEATGHFVAGILYFGLPPGVLKVHVIDSTASNGQNHIFPAYEIGDKEFLVVVLDSETDKMFPTQESLRKVHIVVNLLRNDLGNEIGRDILGGGHLVGGTVLRFYGMGSLVDNMEKNYGDNLPDWARNHSQQSQDAATIAQIAADAKAAKKKQADDDAAKKKADSKNDDKILDPYADTTKKDDSGLMDPYPNK